MSGDVRLTGGTVVTSWSPPRVAKADLSIHDGRVVALPEAVSSGLLPIDCSGCLVIPGNVCAHHHLYSTLARGMPATMARPESFLDILRQVWWRLDRALDLPAIWHSAWAGGAEALLAGTTSILDHHSSPHAVERSLTEVAGALGQLGARAGLCYEVTDREGPDAAAAALKETHRFEEERASLDGGGLLRTMVGAHASFTLSDSTLEECAAAARELDTGLHIHVAEDEVDQRDALARSGRRVVRRLSDAGVLGDRALLAHCIHLDAEELDILRESGATAVHNPRSNMNNGVGRAPIGRLDRLAIGTDGITADMFAEARAGYWRARESDLGVAPQWALDRLAESASFAGRLFGEPLLGRLVEGAPADVAVLEYDPPTPLDDATLAGHVLFGLSSRQVRDVLVAGREVVRDRRLVRSDQAEVLGRTRVVADRLWRRMEDIPEHPFVPEGEQ